jgi:hypothetical protein
MGQQQLLLIVLGVIAVGIAVVIGITLFGSNAVSSNRDAVVHDLNNLGAIALQYYMKPVPVGGGGYTFTGWTLPPQLDTTSNGNYKVTANKQKVTIQGYGVYKTSNGKILQYTATVTPKQITVVKKY